MAAQYPSGPLHTPKSMGAQVPYIKWDDYLSVSEDIGLTHAETGYNKQTF